MRTISSTPAAVVVAATVFFGALVPAAEADPGERNLAALEGQLASISRGFENSWKRDDVGLAERVYDLEARGLELLRRVGSTELPANRANERHRAIKDVNAFLGRVFQLQETLWRGGIEKIHVRNRIDNRPEPPTDLTGARVDYYRALDREGSQRPGGPDPKKAIAEAKAAFKGKVYPLDHKFIESLPAASYVTWVHDSEGIKVSADPKAKHLAMAKGNVKGAGDAYVVKNKRNDVLMFAIQPSSGSFKPGVASSETVRQRAIELDIAPDRVQTTFSRPGSAQLISVLLRAKGLSKDIATKRVEQLEAKAERYRTRRQGLSESRLGSRPTSLAKALKAVQVPAKLDKARRLRQQSSGTRASIDEVRNRATPRATRRVRRR